MELFEQALLLLFDALGLNRERVTGAAHLAWVDKGGLTILVFRLIGGRNVVAILRAMMSLRRGCVDGLLFNSLDTLVYILRDFLHKLIVDRQVELHPSSGCNICLFLIALLDSLLATTLSVELSRIVLRLGSREVQSCSLRLCFLFCLLSKLKNFLDF